MQVGVDQHGADGAPESEVVRRKPEDAPRDHEQPQHVHHADRPHDRTKKLDDQLVDPEDAGGFIVPDVAIELGAVEEVLGDHAIGRLVAMHGIADVGKGAQGDKKQGERKPAAGALGHGRAASRSGATDAPESSGAHFSAGRSG